MECSTSPMKVSPARRVCVGIPPRGRMYDDAPRDVQNATTDAAYSFGTISGVINVTILTVAMKKIQMVSQSRERSSSVKALRERLALLIGLRSLVATSRPGVSKIQHQLRTTCSSASPEGRPVTLPSPPSGTSSSGMRGTRPEVSLNCVRPFGPRICV